MSVHEVLRCTLSVDFHLGLIRISTLP